MPRYWDINEDTLDGSTEHVRTDHLMPDEDPDDYLALTHELLKDMAPATARQKLVARSIIDIEWDIIRHRRLIAGITRLEFCRQVSVTTGRDAYNSSTAPIVKSELGQLLLKGDAASQRTLATYRVTEADLTAAAIMVRSETIAYHEGRIADLERRRRALLADYDRLTSRSATQRDPDLEDAEVID